MVHTDQAQLALTEVEQTNTTPVDPSTHQDGINMICKFISYTLLK